MGKGHRYLNWTIEWSYAAGLTGHANLVPYLQRPLGFSIDDVIKFSPEFRQTVNVIPLLCNKDFIDEINIYQSPALETFRKKVDTYCKEYGKAKKTWLDIISQERLEEEFYIQAFKDYDEDYKRTKHILSVGNYWIGEEWILVLTHRLTWEIIKDFLYYRGLPFPSDMDLEGLCAEMKELSQTKKNKRVFESSVATMQKNSPLPFVDIWFEADRRDEYLKDK